MTLTFDPLTLKVCGRSDGTRLSSVLNLIEIGQPPAEIFKILQIFARFTSRWDIDLLTHWPWTFVVVRASCVQTLCKIWAKSNNPLQSYWRFSYLFPRGVLPNSTPQRGVDRTPPNWERTELRYRRTHSEAIAATCYFVLKWRLVDNERCQHRGQIAHILTPFKN